MRAKKNVAEVEDVRYLRPLLRIKTTIRYDTIEEINVDSKAEYTA